MPLKLRLKKLAELLTFPEVKALWALVCTPLEDILAFHQRIATLEHELNVAEEEMEYGRKVLRLLMSFKHAGIKYKFECQACRMDGEQMAPPQLVWSDHGEPLQCCASCAPMYWDGKENKNYRPQIRPIKPAPPGWLRWNPPSPQCT